MTEESAKLLSEWENAKQRVITAENELREARRIKQVLAVKLRELGTEVNENNYPDVGDKDLKPIVGGETRYASIVQRSQDPDLTDWPGG